MIKTSMQDFEEEAQQFLGSALSICEDIVSNNCDTQQKIAFCAATLSLQEAIKMFINLAKSV